VPRVKRTEIEPAAQEVLLDGDGAAKGRLGRGSVSQFVGQQPDLGQDLELVRRQLGSVPIVTERHLESLAARRLPPGERGHRLAEVHRVLKLVRVEFGGVVQVIERLLQRGSPPLAAQKKLKILAPEGATVGGVDEVDPRRETDQSLGLLEGKLLARRLFERPLLAQQIAWGAYAAEIAPETDERARRGEGEHESDQASGDGVEGADAEGDGVLRPGDAVEAKTGGQQHEQQRRRRRVQGKIDRGLSRDRHDGGQQRRDRPPRGARQSTQAREGGPTQQTDHAQRDQDAGHAELGACLQVLRVCILGDAAVFRPVGLDGKGIAGRDVFVLAEPDADPGVVEHHRPGALPDREPGEGEIVRLRERLQPLHQRVGDRQQRDTRRRERRDGDFPGAQREQEKQPGGQGQGAAARAGGQQGGEEQGPFGGSERRAQRVAAGAGRGKDQPADDKQEGGGQEAGQEIRVVKRPRGAVTAKTDRLPEHEKRLEASLRPDRTEREGKPGKARVERQIRVQGDVAGDGERCRLGRVVIGRKERGEERPEDEKSKQCVERVQAKLAPGRPCPGS